MTTANTALTVTSPAALNALNTTLTLDEVKGRIIPVESMGHTFKAKFGGTCALSGARIWGGEECRMVNMAGWDKPRCALNSAYGAVANCGWYEGRWTGRLLASLVTADEVLDLLAQNPGLVLRTWSTSQLFNHADYHTPGNTWRFDANTKKYHRSGIGGSADKSRAQAKTCILGSKVFACTLG